MWNYIYIWQNQISADHLHLPHGGLLNRPRRRARPRTRKMELVELTAKQTEDEHENEDEDEDEDEPNDELSLHLDALLLKRQSFFHDQTGRLRPGAMLI